jgi:predicted nucleic acid-binding protein
VPLVLDVSAALSWLVVDERDDLAVAMAEAVIERGAIVPSLWRLELRNALLAAERRGRLSNGQLNDLLADLRSLPIEVVPGLPRIDDELEITLARKYGLSVYDAAYLELAVRNAALLMTRDEALGASAEDLQLRWRPG